MILAVSPDLLDACQSFSSMRSLNLEVCVPDSLKAEFFSTLTENLNLNGGQLVATLASVYIN